jgi:hypothetical protein
MINQDQLENVHYYPSPHTFYNFFLSEIGSDARRPVPSTAKRLPRAINKKLIFHTEKSLK